MKKFTIICIIVMLASLLTVAVACNNEVVLRFISNGEQIASVKAKAGEDISDRLPTDPERNNFVFGGWYLDEQCTGEKQVLPDVMPKSSATYYAKWTPIGDSDTVTLTLDTNGGGTLETTVYSLETGTNLKQFLQDKTPNVIDGVNFVGWFLGSSPITDRSTINYSMTLTARYTTNYTIKLFEMDENGDFHESTREPISGTTYFGEAFDCSAEISVPEYFELDPDAEGSKLYVDSVGVGEQFNAYFARQKHYVLFRANPLEDVNVLGNNSRQLYFYHGQTVLIDDFAFDLSRPDRLIGWSQTSNGDVYKKPGESFVIDTDVTLFAVWQQAYLDMFGGSDVLYLPEEEEGVVHLSRSYFESDLLGSYEPSTGAFAFSTQGGDILLDGRISGNYFYYYRDALENSYNDMDETGDMIAIAQHGRTVYTHEGESIEGYYSVDVDTGYFRFESDTENFLFNLFERTTDGEVLFRRQHLDEVGNFAMSNGCVISLDGLGGLTYHYNEENYDYTIAGMPVYEVYGYYEWQEEYGHFLGYTRDATGILFELVFYIDEDADIPPVTGFDNLEINGVIVRDDGMRATYTDKWESTTDELYLDGFSQATFGSVSGSYELFKWIYVYTGEDGDEITDYILVRMNGDDGTIYYFRLDDSYADFEIDRIIKPNDVRQDYAVGRYDFDRVYTLGTWFDGFIYIFENGGAELWTVYGQTDRGETIYILYTELVSTVTKQENGIYTFDEKINETTGEAYGNSFDFSLQEDKLTEVYPERHDIVTVDTDLVLDRTVGQATYKGVNVAYGYTLGYVDYYIFIVEGRQLRYIRIADETQETFVPIFPQDQLFIRYPGDSEQNYYTGCLLFVGNDVYLGLLLDDTDYEMYRYIGVGTASQVSENSDEYDFVLNSWLENEFSRANLADYIEFRYKTVDEDGVTYFIQHQSQSSYEFDNFHSDGYGNYRFTGADGEEITGTIAAMMGNIILFVDNNENACIFAIDGEQVYNVTETGDAGFYYEMNSNGLVSQDRYLVFDGLGNVTLCEVDILTGEFYEPQTARYVRTANWRADYLEYDIQPTLYSAGSTTTVLSRVLVGIYSVSGQVFPLYQSRIDHRVGDYSVSGGGHITSDGYPAEEATYITADGTRYSGNMYIGNFNTGTSDHSFINDATGSYVHFWVSVNGTLTSEHFYFEIVAGRLVELTLPYGEYAFYDGEKTIATRRLILNGRGGATLRDSTDSSSVEGVYSYDERTDSYTFTTPLNSFVFRLGYDSSNDLSVYVYYIYNSSADRFYRNPNDFSSLDVDGFGNGTCIDRYGRVYDGYVVIFAEGYGYFGSNGLTRVFTFDNENGTYSFVDHTEHIATYYSPEFSSFILGEALLTVNGVDYYYIVDEETITAYAVDGDEVLTFALPDGDFYNLDDVSYYRYNGGALTFTDDEFAVRLTLGFTPNGAVFSTQATVNDDSNGFTINISYGANGVVVTLNYNSGQMDAATETYLITLHYEGDNNTFSIIPGGHRGEYIDSVSSDSVLTIDARTIGPYLVGDGSITYHFTYITDSAGAEFRGTSTYDALRLGSSDFNYGYSFVAGLQGTDGIVYSFEFYLVDAERKQLILSAVTVDNVFELDDLSVTVSQLWQSGRLYKDAERYDIVGLSIPEDGVTTTIFQSTVENGEKAVLVRQMLNMTTGVYTYNAYVFSVGYENQFVSSLTEDGKYNYAEANRGGDYMVRFLYTNDGGTFNVGYVLTFTIGTSIQQATFTQKGDNVFEIEVANGSVYSVTIRRVGTEFVLEVTPL